MHQPLSSWINRTHPLPERFYNAGHQDKPKDHWDVWLSVEEVAPLYLAQEMKWLSLKESRENTARYLEESSKLISGLDGGWLDKYEQELILEKLGKPPLPSLPIYLISCSNGTEENLVYVGKTKNTSRFAGGHTAALKLHNPKLRNTTKKIYRSTVWFYNNDEYISLDWIQPEDMALQLLDSVESHLIYNFKPELNINKKKNVSAKWDFYIHIQNFLEGNFLNDTFV